MTRFERHGSELAARPNVAWGATTDPEGSCSGGPKLEVQPRPSSESGPGPSEGDYEPEVPHWKQHQALGHQAHRAR